MKYCRPPQLCRTISTAIQAATHRVIDPLVKESVITMRARRSSNAISDLRSQAESIAKNDEELKAIRKLLHEPTLTLREGIATVDIASVISQIEKEIDSMRSPTAVP